jgi:hypothetical protein
MELRDEINRQAEVQEENKIIDKSDGSNKEKQSPSAAEIELILEETGDDLYDDDVINFEDN